MSGDVDLADEPRVRHRATGADDPHRSRRNDAFEIGMALDESLRLAIALVGGVVAINDADQRHLGVIGLFQLLLHLLDPDILFVACEVAERMAISPSPPMVFVIMRTSLAPTSSSCGALICIARPSGAIPESKERTVMPRRVAFFVVGISACASFAEMSKTSTCCAISVSMTAI